MQEYRFDQLLGVGGFGLTYLATDENLNLPVAIKEYLPSDIARRDEDSSVRPAHESVKENFEWGLRRFLDEARTLAAFHHPNIVRVMRYFQANSTAYMVMEFVEGAPLSEWVKTRRPLSQRAIETLIRPLVHGLQVVHKAGYLHRDIKPGNIYVRADGSPVLLDFGAARSTLGRSELTAVVSPGYAPVEQYSESSPQGPWSDLYALGGVMYWLVTGNKPVDATARLRDDPQPKAATIGDSRLYTPGFLNAIDWALEPDDRKRPRHGDDFLAMLLTVAQPGDVAAQDDRTLTLPVANIPYMDDAPTQPASVSIDAAQLKDIESELAKRIGPLASVLLKKAVRAQPTIDGVIAQVAREIDDDNERTLFTKKVRGNTQPPSLPSGRSSNTEIATQIAATRFDLSVLERAERRLAQHIGAIARVIVKKAAMKARDEGELYLIIADEINDPVDRKAFIKKAISASGKSGPQIS
ncbi:MAG: protein kinase [Betaproteobacteria bacterium]|nr:protein kinase [Betaproteobacteria bacterium]